MSVAKIAVGVAAGILLAGIAVFLFANSRTYLQSAPERAERSRLQSKLETMKKEAEEQIAIRKNRDSEYSLPEVYDICKEKGGLKNRETVSERQIDFLISCGQEYGKSISRWVAENGPSEF